MAALFGFLFGFVGSIPVAGPISILVLKNGMNKRFRAAFGLSAGAAMAEAIYAFLAFWGFAHYLTQYQWINPLSKIIAAIIFFLLGYLLIFRSDMEVSQVKHQRTKTSLLLGFTIAALNPTLIATWTAGVSSLYSLEILRFNEDHSIPFSIGAFIGIFGWFALLLGMLRKFHFKLSPARVRTFAKYLGFFVTILGLYFTYRAAIYFAGFQLH